MTRHSSHICVCIYLSIDRSIYLSIDPVLAALIPSCWCLLCFVISKVHGFSHFLVPVAKIFGHLWFLLAVLGALDRRWATLCRSWGALCRLELLLAAFASSLQRLEWFLKTATKKVAWVMHEKNVIFTHWFVLSNSICGFVRASFTSPYCICFNACCLFCCERLVSFLLCSVMHQRLSRGDKDGPEPSSRQDFFL